MQIPTFKFVSVNDAIKQLETMKKYGKKGIVCIIDFDNNTEARKTVNYDESCLLIKKANTIIHNQDDFIPHLELYSAVQKDIKNIIPIGTMHDIYINARI